MVFVNDQALLPLPLSLHCRLQQSRRETGCAGDFGGYWPKHKAYMAELGIDDSRNYFNSGVLAFRLDTWREIAPRALDTFPAIRSALSSMIKAP
ncbi:hypothetical protein ABID21_004016 [Pseudorhizobium tarimense]|uniref:Uncharacterized protein n=1 Tax=Pseudorhizobium tarimense TaxID=1079109 RepID=A0ABV2HBL0_9HYPH